MNGLQDKLFSKDFICIICRKFNGGNFRLLCKHMKQDHDRFQYCFSSETTNSKHTVTIYLKKYNVASDDEDSLSEIEYIDDSKVRLTESDLAEDLALTHQLYLHLCEQKLLEKSFLSIEEQTFMALWNRHAMDEHSIIFKINIKTEFEALLQSFIPLLAETILNSGKACFRDFFVRLLCSISTTHHGLLTPAQIVTCTSQLDQIVSSFREKVYNKVISDYVSSFY